MSRLALRLVLFSLVVAGPLAVDARADVIDFTDPAIFGGADGLASFGVTVGGLGLQFDPLPTPDATLYWDSTDGFGVRHAYEADEIEADEILNITFTSGSVYLDAVFLTDLFYEGQPEPFEETGFYRLSVNGIEQDWIEFAQTDHGILPSPITNGEFTLVLNASNVTSIAFRAPGIVNGQGHEFSVAGIEVYVPEPSTLVLLGSGLVVGAVVRRRWRA